MFVTHPLDHASNGVIRRAFALSTLGEYLARSAVEMLVIDLP